MAEWRPDGVGLLLDRWDINEGCGSNDHGRHAPGAAAPSQHSDGGDVVRDRRLDDESVTKERP